jgi:hypothetical protein
MSVKAKFYVTDIEPNGGPQAAILKMQAVCRGVENAMWAQATPWGNITMGIKNDPATQQFEKGAEYEVIFRKVEKPTPGDGHEIVQATTMHGAIVCETCGAHLGVTKAAIEKGWGVGLEPGLIEQNVKAHDELYGNSSK